jgi:1-acyl-sn-glycerol-3-phosphate acyltransferase
VGGLRDAEDALSARRHARRAARIAGFGALTAGMLPGMLCHQALVGAANEARRDAVGRAWLGAWSTAMLALFGLQVTVTGPLPAPGRARLIVANHRSTADILILLRMFGAQLVSRADLARWPLIGRAARSVGTVFVDRKDAASGATAVRLICSRLEAGASVAVFPEGTTFPDDEVRSFQTGAFLAAARAKADVLPVGLAYQRGSGAAFFGETFPAHLSRMAAAEPSHVVMCVGPVIDHDGALRAAALRARAHAAVETLVQQARNIVDA